MVRAVAAELVALLAPPACPGCCAPVPSASLCSDCRRNLPWLRCPRCPRCCLPAPCGRCPARGAAYERSWAPVAYAGPARGVVAALKRYGSAVAVEIMAAQLVAGAPAGLLERVALVPVPAHPARRRERGFDQAEQLARALGRRSGLPVAPCLKRAGAARRQLGAGRRERLASGRMAVAARRRPPDRALLVDDVHTTGATLDACARALREAGCASVAAVTYARTLREG